MAWSSSKVLAGYCPNIRLRHRHQFSSTVSSCPRKFRWPSRLTYLPESLLGQAFLLTCRYGIYELQHLQLDPETLLRWRWRSFAVTPDAWGPCLGTKFCAPWMVLLRLKNAAKLIPVHLRNRTTVPSCLFLKISSLNWAIRIRGVELKTLRWFKVDHRGKLCSTRKKWGSTHRYSLDTEVSSQIMPHLIHRLLPYIWLWLPPWVLTCSF